MLCLFWQIESVLPHCMALIFAGGSVGFLQEPLGFLWKLPARLEEARVQAALWM